MKARVLNDRIPSKAIVVASIVVRVVVVVSMLLAVVTFVLVMEGEVVDVHASSPGWQSVGPVQASPVPFAAVSTV